MTSTAYQQMIFVNLPVNDLDASKKFFTELGYSINPQFSDENAASVVISDTIVAMLLTKPFYSTFTKKEIADASTTSEVIICLSAESREKVDELVEKAGAAGGTVSHKVQDPGFMYGRAFDDPDGHTWEVVWMDPAAIEG
ncbi:VOC family protein [Streptomyces sp. NPDC087859]|uniref:VOC family protein n=1 Tax=Streptomyces sp. NPDC087859 TaxID=3365812 RepID=UPI00380904BB